MCLILLSWRDRRYRLVVAANRDEYFRRPAAPAGFWEDHPGVLAGRDLEAGGTWLGVTLDGRFAALTNYRNPAERNPAAPSRGALVADFLTGDAAPLQYLRGVERRAVGYNGFSLLVGDATSLYFLSNRGGHLARVEPGIHGLSNHVLDTPWPKVEKGKSAFTHLLEKPFDAGTTLQLLDDTERAPNADLPKTGVSPEVEERLSAIRIPALDGYGTRCSTALCIGHDGRIEFRERTFREDGSAADTVSYRLTLEPGKDRGPSRRAGSPPRGTRFPAR